LAWCGSGKRYYNERYSETSIGDEIDFTKLAGAFGIKSMKITEDAEVEKVLKKALKLNEPVLVECMIHPNDMVLPMVPAGEPINECIDDI
jgi:acetolactate synthase-1/2/3 large subunit